MKNTRIIKANKIAKEIKTKKVKSNIVSFKVFTCPFNYGDGEYYVEFFNSIEAYNKYVEVNTEEDNIEYVQEAVEVELQFDLKTGKLVNPTKID